VGQIRTDVNFSAETYRLIKESHCIFMGMGFESSNDRVLKIMKKRTTFSDHLRNLTRAKEAGLNVFGNFMFGHETETADEIKETFNFINQYDLIQGPANGLATIIIYPGTSYYRTAEKNGLIDDPFKFLLSYAMKAGISSVDIREKYDASRLNISALSNDEFYTFVCTENIKHRRIYSKRHAAVDVKRTFEFGSVPGFVFEGECPTCRNLVKFDSKVYLNPLNITKICEGCYYTLVLNIYQFSETENYLKDIKERIEQSNKIVVYGSWIMDLIYCDALSIPYEKIIAWVDPENPEVSDYKYFYHMPQLSLEKVKDYEYDTIITLKQRVLSTPRMIEKHGLNPQCKTINLLPDILNTDLANALRGKKIAIAGISDAVQKVKKLLETENSVGRLDHFSDVLEICNENNKYDFVVFDKDEYGINRKEFAQNSRYQINEILHVEFLYDGGFYTGC
jgi:predicted CopG family antitoxin